MLVMMPSSATGRSENVFIAASSANVEATIVAEKLSIKTSCARLASANAYLTSTGFMASYVNVSSSSV
jgi:hypothetical protein